MFFVCFSLNNFCFNLCFLFPTLIILKHIDVLRPSNAVWNILLLFSFTLVRPWPWMRKVYGFWSVARNQVVNVSYFLQRSADRWDQTLYMGSGLGFPLLDSGAKITTWSTVKKPPLSLFLLSVQFGENCRNSCSRHQLLLHLFLRLLAGLFTWAWLWTEFNWIHSWF